MGFNEKAIQIAGENLIKAERCYQEALIRLETADKQLEDAGHKVEIARTDLAGYEDNRRLAREAYTKAFH